MCHGTLSMLIAFSAISDHKASACSSERQVYRVVLIASLIWLNYIKEKTGDGGMSLRYQAWPEAG
jgi:hypothetical protein